MKTITILATLVFLSCGSSYGGARCRGITLNTDPATLPLGPRSPASAGSLNPASPYLTYVPELPCCLNNPEYRNETSCSAVDCDALIGRLTVATVEGPFLHEPCGRLESPGGSTCTVHLDGSKIVAVNVFCAD